MPVQAKNTMELLAAINMSLGDIKAKMEKDSKSKASNSSRESMPGISGKDSLKKFGPMVAAGQALSSIGKGLLNIAKVGNPKKVGEYLDKISEFVEKMEKFGKGFSKSIGKDVAKSMKDFSSGMAELMKAVTLKNIIVLKLAGSVLNEKTGKQIGKFYSSLVKELKKGVSKADKKFIEDLGKLTNSITKLFMTLIIAVGILMLLLAFKPALLVEALLTVTVILGLTIGAFILINKYFGGEDGRENKENVETFTSSVSALCIAVLVIVVLSFIAKFIPMDGLLMTGAIIVVTLGVMLALSKIVAENGKQMLLSIIGFTVLLLTLVLSLAIIRSMVKSKKGLENTIIGLVILAAMIGMVLGIFYVLSRKEVEEKMIQAGAILIVITVMLGILSGIMKYLLIPIGKKWEKTLIGITLLAIMVAGVLGIIALLGSDMIKTELVKAQAQALLLVTITASLMGLAYTIKIIADTFGTDIALAATSMAILAVLATGLYVFAQALATMGEAGTKLITQIAVAAAVIGITELVIVSMVGVIWLTMEMFRTVDEYGWDKYLENLGLTLLVIGGIALIMAGLGALVTLEALILLAAVVLASVALTMVALAGVVTVSVMMLKSVESYGGIEKFTKDLLLVEGVVAAYGYILELMSVVLLPLAFVMPLIIAELATIQIATLSLGLIIVTLIGVLKLIEATRWTKDDVTALSEVAIGMIIGFMTPILDNILTFAAMFLLVIPVVTTLSILMPTLAIICLAMIGILKLFVNFVKNDLGMRIEDFKNKDNAYTACVNTLATSIIDFFRIMSEGLLKIGPFTALIMMVIAKELMPVLDMISQFVDIVEKVATMNVIIGYDENGKPQYKHLPPDTFAKSAKAITDGFNNFITGIKAGFDQLTIGTVLVMEWMSARMFPIIELVSEFIDAVIKVATMTIITGYDENGKPEYEKLPDNTFSKAADDIGKGFAAFIKHLDEAFKNLSEDAIDAMDDMEDVFKPVLDAVSAFVDATIRLATAQYIEDYEVIESKKGGQQMLKPVYGTIPCVRGGTNWAYDAAYTIAETFGFFITTLGESMKALDDDKIDLLEDLSEILEPILNSVSTYIDAAIKVATAQYIKGYDENGKPEYEKLEPGWAKRAATDIARAFGQFINTLALSTWLLSDDTEDALEAIAENVEPIMNAVGSYADALVKLGQNQYAITGYDEKGNPIYDTSKPIDWGELGEKVADTYIQFILTFCRKAKSHEQEIEESQNAVETLGNAFPPIMDMLSKYASSVEKLLKKVGGSDKEGDEGVEIYTKMAEATQKAIDGIYTIFEGPRALSADTIKRWQLDTGEALSSYKNLTKAINEVQRTAGSLKKIYDDFSSDNSKEGEASVDKSMKLRSIMENLSAAVITWGTKDFKSAAAAMLINTPIIIISLSAVSSIFKTLRRDSMNLSTAVTDLGKSLDDVLINQKDARIQALEEVRQSFDKVSESIDKVKNSMQELAKQDFDTLSASIEKVAESFMKAFEEHNSINAVANPDEFNGWVKRGGDEEAKTNAGGKFTGGKITGNMFDPFGQSRKDYDVPKNTYNTITQPTGRQMRNITVYFGAKAFHGRIEL